MPSDTLVVTWDVRSKKKRPHSAETNKQTNKKPHNCAISTTGVLKGQLFLLMTQKLSKELQLKPMAHTGSYRGCTGSRFNVNIPKYFTDLMNAR